MPVLKYCLHATSDGAEIVSPIADADAYLRERIAAHWRALPLTKRVTEAGVRSAVEAAFRDVESVLRSASLRA